MLELNIRARSSRLLSLRRCIDQSRTVRLIAVSPQGPDGSPTTQQKHDLAFAVLSDPRNVLAHLIGIVTAPSSEERAAQLRLGLDLTVVNADSTTELLNLMVTTQLFFHRNKYLELDRDPDNAGAGQVRYEMDIAPDGALKITSQPNESNVRSFSGRLVIRGFDLEDLAAFPNEGVVSRGTAADDVAIQAPEPLGASGVDAGASG